MTNEKAPERIIICIDGYKPAIADWAKDRMKECDIEYVRADLLATVRKEERKAAFTEIRKRIEATNPNLTFGSANGSVMKKCILMEVNDLEGDV